MASALVKHENALRWVGEEEESHHSFPHPTPTAVCTTATLEIVCHGTQNMGSEREAMHALSGSGSRRLMEVYR